MRLPSLNALRAFDAAARYLSFTKAAAELNVTPAAVSHQVKVLEGDLDAILFRRGTRQLELTAEGATLAPRVRAAFAELAAATATLRQRRQERPLTLSVAPAFASKWLIPRLTRFHARHPDITVRIDASVGLADYAAEGIDAGIRYGMGEYPGMVAVRLIGGVVFPVASPALVAAHPPLRNPGDLATRVLLDDDWSRSAPDFPTWSHWLAAAGYPGLEPRVETFSHLNYAYQAAVDGVGVALARSELVAKDIAEGRLVRLFDVSIPVDFAFYFVYPEGGQKDARVAAFRDWVLDEVAADEDNGGQRA